MNPKDIDHITEQTLQSWDNMQPAEVSPFLWTRISSTVFTSIKPQKSLIAQPVMQLFLGVWVLLIVAHASFWLVDNSKPTSSVSTEVRSAFFSDDNPYSSY